MTERVDLDSILPAELLDLEFGGWSVRQNLGDALKQGDLVWDGQCRLKLAEGNGSKDNNWLYVWPLRHSHPHCRLLLDVLFEIVYAKAAVPMACVDCYKVKVCPPDFKGLLALRQISRDIPCNSKCGPEVNHYYSQDLYGGLFYCRGLEQARAVYRQIRERVDRDSALGSGVTMRIKRGCTPYEIHCGPSDRWSFHPAQIELENRLLALMARPTGQKNEPEFATLMHWVRIAHSIRDDSYLEFTKGRRLYPPTTDYDP